MPMKLAKQNNFSSHPQLLPPSTEVLESSSNPTAECYSVGNILEDAGRWGRGRAGRVSPVLREL